MVFFLLSHPKNAGSNLVLLGTPSLNRCLIPANYKDGFLGIPSAHIFCGISQRPHKASAGVWIDSGDKDKNRAIFDLLCSHKKEIESKVSKPLNWNSKDNNRAYSITVILDKANYTNPEEWPTIAEFHAKMLKELRDYVLEPYREQLINL